MNSIDAYRELQRLLGSGELWMTLADTIGSDAEFRFQWEVKIRGKRYAVRHWFSDRAAHNATSVHEFLNCQAGIMRRKLDFAMQAPVF